MPSPKKLSHLVLQTNRRDQMIEWYCTVLGAQVLHQNKQIAFISYDDEHHRVAFIDPGPLAEKAPAEGKTARAAARSACTTWRSRWVHWTSWPTSTCT
jgi:catechol-2,3-dioxygenase